MKILIVDDALTIRNVIKATLQPHGFDIKEATNGQQALEIAKKEKFNLIISDINMPIMDGLEFLRKFRQFNKNTPFLILTTESDLSKKSVAKSLGATGWIVKPFKALDLINVVKRVTRR